MELRDSAQKIGLDVGEEPDILEVVEENPKSLAEQESHFYAFWRNSAHADDPNLRMIMQEIALKSSVTSNTLIVEQKRERLMQAYINLLSRVQRSSISKRLDDPEATDVNKYAEIRGLFEINYFHSSTFHDLVKPYGYQEAKTPTRSSRREPLLGTHSPSHSVSSNRNTTQSNSELSPVGDRQIQKQRNVSRNSALFFNSSPSTSRSPTHKTPSE